MDRRTLIAGLALWAATPHFAAAQSGWIRLGSRTVNWASSRASITVPRASGPISQLSFRTRRGEIFITNVEVSAVDGSRQRLPVNMRIRPNFTSNVVRLRGPSREIRRIEFWYRRVSHGGTMPATVEVFGRR